MRSCTERRKRSRLQGHRKRRREIRVRENVANEAVCWTEYKTYRQYVSVGDVLGELRTYGFSAGLENVMNGTFSEEVNGCDWISAEDDSPYDGAAG